MSLTESFQQAVVESKQLSRRPDNSTLLRLYSLYKQATDGDAPAESGAGMFDFVARAKHNAWDKLRGKTKDAAMEEYVKLARSLKDSDK
jgi:diazepam-binding inhibitor (GABA receptor modulating acyl-CoA-binding protein)